VQYQHQGQGTMLLNALTNSPHRYKEAMDAAPQQFKEFSECLDQNA
jgi:hypothetical protein